MWLVGFRGPVPCCVSRRTGRLRASGSRPPIDSTRPASFHDALARELAPLRDQGVFIVGSGDIVHNLGVVDFGRPDGYDWAVRFNDEVKNRILAGGQASLGDYETLG